MLLADMFLSPTTGYPLIAALLYAFAALVLMANNPPSWTSLRKGAVVTTGSCIVPYLASKTGTYTADFGILGKSEITMV